MRYSFLFSLSVLAGEYDDPQLALKLQSEVLKMKDANELKELFRLTVNEQPLLCRETLHALQAMARKKRKNA